MLSVVALLLINGVASIVAAEAPMTPDVYAAAATQQFPSGAEAALAESMGITSGYPSSSAALGATMLQPTSTMQPTPAMQPMQPAAAAMPSYQPSAPPAQMPPAAPAQPGPTGAALVAAMKSGNPYEQVAAMQPTPQPAAPSPVFPAPNFDPAVAAANYNVPAYPTPSSGVQPTGYGGPAAAPPSSRTAPFTAGAPGGMGGYGIETAALPPPPARYAQFGGPPAGAGGEPPSLDPPISSGDLLRRLEAAEAELNALHTQMEPNNRRLKELEDKQRAAAAIDKPLPMIRLSGFLQNDTGWFSQDSNSKDVLGNMQNGTDFRRARLQGLGQLTEFTTFSVEMDFAGPGRPSFMDVWGEQSNLPVVGHARIGQFRQPVTMDAWTNVKHLDFLERSAPFIAFDPFRRVGIMGWDTSEDERTMWAYSLFSTGFTFWNGASTTYSTLGNDDRFGTQIGDSGGVSFSTRFSHLLYYDPNANNRYLMHVGGGYLYGQMGGSGTTGPFAKTYEARTVPEVFIGDQGAAGLTAGGTPNVIDTGRFLANHYQMLHAEVAGNWGPAHYQAEYMAQFVEQMGGGNVFYDGGYIQGGVFLTGENAGYNKLTGVMDYNVKPNSEFFGIGRKKALCGWGAWEVAARWSWVDLSSMNVRASNYLASLPGPPPSPNPGILNEPTVALNWWWNQYMRVQFNYIHSMVNSNLYGFYAQDVYALRFQTEF